MDFSEIHRWVDKHQPRSVCVEAAHIYMNATPNDEHYFSAQVGARLSEELETKDCFVSKMLFIDNYNPGPDEFVLDVEGYLAHLRQEEFGPNIVTFETALELPARNLLMSLNNNVYKLEGRIFLNHRNILVMDHERPTCNLLDATLYVAKFSLFELSITVLPNSYKTQQASVRRVLRALGYTHLSIINVYFDENRQITIGIQS